MVFIAILNKTNPKQDEIEVFPTSFKAADWLANKIADKFDEAHKNSSKVENKFKHAMIDLNGDAPKVKADCRADYSKMILLKHDFSIDVSPVVIEKSKPVDKSFLDRMNKAKLEKVANCKCELCEWCEKKKEEKKKAKKKAPAPKAEDPKKAEEPKKTKSKAKPKPDASKKIKI